MSVCKNGTVKLGMFLPPVPDRRWHLAAQAGVTNAICKFDRQYDITDLDSFASAQKKFAEDGFMETFHDNGPTDMAARLKLLCDLNMDVLLRPDHAPTMFGEDNDQPGYAALGRIFAIGYFKGILDSITSNDKV